MKARTSPLKRNVSVNNLHFADHFTLLSTDISFFLQHHHIMPERPPGYANRRKPPRWAYLRSFLPLLSMMLVFSFLLASYSLLSHFRSPAIKQHLGWQSWDMVRVERSKLDTNQSFGDSKSFSPSIPIDVWVSRFARLSMLLIGRTLSLCTLLAVCDTAHSLAQGQ
jgi:hypothetical protein